MALLMLCSMVMCVSAADKTIEGLGFTINVPDTYTFNDYSDSEDIHYWINVNGDEESSELEIFISEPDDPKAEFEEITKGDEITEINGKPAAIHKCEDGKFYGITIYTDKYLYSIECEGDVEGAKAAFEIVKTMKFTDVSADDADNQDDTTTIGAIEENTPNTTVLIAVIAVAAVLIVAGVVIIVVFTKKKKNN